MNFTLTPSLKTIINVIVLVTPAGLKVDKEGGMYTNMVYILYEGRGVRGL